MERIKIDGEEKLRPSAKGRKSVMSTGGADHVPMETLG
jgi:hypothetical protein